MRSGNQQRRIGQRPRAMRPPGGRLAKATDRPRTEIEGPPAKAGKSSAAMPSVGALTPSSALGIGVTASRTWRPDFLQGHSLRGGVLSGAGVCAIALSPQQHRWPFAGPAWARFVTAPMIAQQHNCGPIRTVNASQAMMPRRANRSSPLHLSYAAARPRPRRGRTGRRPQGCGSRRPWPARSA